MIETHLTGLRELGERLQRMSAELSRRGMRRATSAGASVVRAAVRSAAPVGPYGAKKRGSGSSTRPGVLRRSVISKWVRQQSNDQQAKFVVTVRRGKKEQGKGRDAFYAGWVEKGHRIVPRKAAKVRGTLSFRRRFHAGGTVRPHPFMAPAFAGVQLRALEAIKRKLGEEVERAAKGSA